jgi:4-oxalocrotonate tautomerase
MVDVLKAPKDDRFQVIAEYPADALIADEKYLGIRRTQDCVFIQLALNIGRSVEQKKAFYKAVAETLHVRLGLRPEDVFNQSHRGSKRELVLREWDRPIRGVAG